MPGKPPDGVNGMRTAEIVYDLTYLCFGAQTMENAIVDPSSICNSSFWTKSGRQVDQQRFYRNAGRKISFSLNLSQNVKSVGLLDIRQYLRSKIPSFILHVDCIQFITKFSSQLGLHR